MFTLFLNFLAGDTHLAMFRVSKVENVEAAVSEEAEVKVDSDTKPETNESS